MSRGWKIALAVSLVLNLFLIGAAVGVAVVGSRVLGERAEVRRPAQAQRVFAAFQVLPPERRAALREIMRAQALSAAPDLRAAAEARREASRLIAAPQYDVKAVTAALAQAREAEGRARARIDATLAARLAELTPQERTTFARVLTRGPGRRGRGPGGPPEGEVAPGGPRPPAPPP